MIVISNPIVLNREKFLINTLFEEGLELLHVRKPNYSDEEIKSFLSEINQEFRSKLVLHNHHQLATEFGINRIHNPVKIQKFGWDKPIFSTSTHSIEEFNELSTFFEYAFLSPLFSSISKTNYHPTNDLFLEIKKRTNFKTRMIALGGIQPENIPKLLQSDFDDCALLGTIWNDDNPIKKFKICQQIAHMH